MIGMHYSTMPLIWMSDIIYIPFIVIDNGCFRKSSLKFSLNRLTCFYPITGFFSVMPNNKLLTDVTCDAITQ